MTELAQTPVGAAVDAQLNLVTNLEEENAAAIDRLRQTQIPQQIGMAAGGRALAAELPRVLVGQVQADLDSAALKERWTAALKRAGTEGVPETALPAVASLLVEQGRAIARYVSARAEEWAAGAYRLEGQANALESQCKRLAEAREGIARSRAEGEAQEARQQELRREVETEAEPATGG